MVECSPGINSGSRSNIINTFACFTHVSSLPFSFMYFSVSDIGFDVKVTGHNHNRIEEC